MKVNPVRVVAILVFALIGCSARATLIGDTITLAHGYPDIGTAYETHDVLVQAGSADVQAMLLGLYVVNPEASTIYTNFFLLPGYDYLMTSAVFDGLIVSGINDTITGVSVDTNFYLWTADRLSWDAHSVSANWRQLHYSADTYFNITLTTGRVVETVPDTGVTGILLGVSLVGLMALRRKIRAGAH